MNKIKLYKMENSGLFFHILRGKKKRPIFYGKQNPGDTKIYQSLAYSIIKGGLNLRRLVSLRLRPKSDLFPTLYQEGFSQCNQDRSSRFLVHFLCFKIRGSLDGTEEKSIEFSLSVRKHMSKRRPFKWGRGPGTFAESGPPTAHTFITLLIQKTGHGKLHCLKQDTNYNSAFC